jgi:hypothetical protein
LLAVQGVEAVLVVHLSLDSLMAQAVAVRAVMLMQPFQ